MPKVNRKIFKLKVHSELLKYLETYTAAFEFLSPADATLLTVKLLLVFIEEVTDTTVILAERHSTSMTHLLRLNNRAGVSQTASSQLIRTTTNNVKMVSCNVFWLNTSD